MYYTILLLAHILLVALFVGSGAALVYLWRQAKRAEGPARSALLETMLAVSRRITQMAGSGLALAGILMFITRPALFSGPGLFKAKIALGLIAVGLSAALHSRLRWVASAENPDRASFLTDRRIDRLLGLLTPLVPLVVLMALLGSHR